MSAAQWKTTAQASFVPYDDVAPSNLSAIRHKKQIDESLKQRSHSPVFAAKSNAEISFHVPSKDQVSPSRSCRPHEEYHDRSHIKTETSTSRLAYAPVDAEELRQVLSDRALRTHSDSSTTAGVTVKFTAVSEQQRQFVPFETHRCKKRREQERPLRANKTAFEAVSTYQSDFKLL